MELDKMINKAISENRAALTEAESKILLAEYGIPVVEESVALTADDAVKAATNLGYPIALKGLGSKLIHKSERGLVALDLNTQADVLDAARVIENAAGNDFEGFLVQRMIRGRREFISGMFCDPLFGPVIMFGLGGILTEAIGDVVYRVAPVEETEVDVMLDELVSSKLLAGFRGEAPVNRKKISNMMLGLSRLSLECPDILEIDINPLIADEAGDIVAVDALIILGTRQIKATQGVPVSSEDVLNMLSPRSIAFIGATDQVGKWGHRLIANTIAGEFPGEIYFVNPKLGEIAGRKVYKSILDLPSGVDLAIVTIPASEVVKLIPHLAEKSIRHMILISSGFAETGADGINVQNNLAKAAQGSGILFIGPNTMGISNPHVKLFMSWTSSRPKAGTAALVSQSGNLGTQFMLIAEKENIGLRYFCGTGNEALVTIEDFLSAIELDNNAEVAVLYVESVKDGRRFLEVAKRTSKKKPIVLLKGGRTKAGHAAAASHTGAMASDIRIFNAACRQAGVILAPHPADLVDFSACFSSLPLPKGNRVGLMTLGGGWGVIATDACAEFGLSIPQLPEGLIRKIDKILPSFWSRGNPIDAVAVLDTTVLIRLIDLLVKWDGCDAIIHLGVVGKSVFFETFRNASLIMDPNVKNKLPQPKVHQEMETEFIRQTIRMMETYKKPVLGVSNLDSGCAVMNSVGAKFKAVSYPSPERAVKCLAAMVQYSQWLNRLNSAEK